MSTYHALLLTLTTICTAAFAVISYLCWRLYRLSVKCAALCECIADMLHDPPNAEPIARATRLALARRGLWLSR